MSGENGEEEGKNDLDIFFFKVRSNPLDGIAWHNVLYVYSVYVV